MIVSHEAFDGIVERLCDAGERGLDTEATGLTEDDSLFSIIISEEAGDFYFNFNPYDDIDDDLVLPRSSIVYLRPIFQNPDSVWFIQNAKFDMRMLAKEGIDIVGDVHCTYAIERVIQNNLIGADAYRLKGLAARRGWAKDEAVENFIAEHKLFTTERLPGKKKIIKRPHFDKVPFSIMSKYACNDGKLHLDIGLDQIAKINELNLNTNYPPLTKIFENEKRLTKTAFKMERRGIQLDVPFTEKALEFEHGEIERAKAEFKTATGKEFADSRVLFKEVFDALGEKYPTTTKGNASFAGDVLEGMSSPIASVINKIRHHDKRAGTYYSSFLHYADSNGVIHPDARQAGTETGRFSYRDPNLQNVPKEDEESDQAIPFHVRECFIPRPGHWYYAIDYKQMEYRMMLDYAGETKLIDSVMSGADVHQATADLVGISRKHAKTLNFAILYGAGVMKIKDMLGVSLKEAKDLKFTYFEKLPKVYRFIRKVVDAGAARGFIYNWYGRRCHIANPQWAYVLPNHLIQGGCADVVKIAMNKIDDYLDADRVKMILQVHDELLFEVPFGDEHHMSKITDLMEHIYEDQNGMKLTTSVSRSDKRWGFRNMEELDGH